MLQKFRQSRLLLRTKVKRETFRERQVRKLVASLDFFIAKLMLTGIVLYVALYGLWQSNGFHVDNLSWAYLWLLIPIWLVDGLKGFVESHLPANYMYGTEDLSKVTVIVGSKDSAGCLPATLKDLLKRFDKEHIIVASNGSTDDTVAIALEHGVRCLDLPWIGKVRAINEAVAYVKTPYVLVLDDDTLIGNARIPTGLLEGRYDAVAFRVLVNQSSWVTKFQMYEYRKSTDIGKRYHNRRATVQNISGAIGLFKKDELERQIALHTAEFSGEDLQRTLLIHMAAENRGVVLSESTVYTDPPVRLGQLFKQRTFGWWPGMYANIGNYLRLMVRRGVPAALRIDGFYNAVVVMGFDVLRLLSLPILIFYPWTFAVMYAAYTLMELGTYFKTGRQDPLWVVLLYPLYGLFGFITRICAFGVFAYRRLVALIARTVYFDDYKHASNLTKVITLIFVALLFESILLFNNAYSYAEAVVGSPLVP